MVASEGDRACACCSSDEASSSGATSVSRIMNAASRRARRSVGASTRIFRVSSSALSGSLSKISDTASNRSTAALPAWASRPPPAPRSRSNRLGRFLATGLTASPSYHGLAGPVHPPPGALAQPELSPTLLRGEIQSDRIAIAARSGCGLRTEHMRCCVKTTAWFVRPLGRPPCAGRLPEILRAAGRRTIYERFFVIIIQYLCKSPRRPKALCSQEPGAMLPSTLTAHTARLLPIIFPCALAFRAPLPARPWAEVGRTYSVATCKSPSLRNQRDATGRPPFPGMDPSSQRSRLQRLMCSSSSGGEKNVAQVQKEELDKAGRGPGWWKLPPVPGVPLEHHTDRWDLSPRWTAQRGRGAAATPL